MRKIQQGKDSEEKMAKKGWEGNEGKDSKERTARKGWRGKEGLSYKELEWLGWQGREH